MISKNFCSVSKLVLFLPVLLALSAADTRPADETVSPELRLIITGCPADSVLSVLVKIEGGTQARTVRRELDALGISRRETHRILIERLKSENGRAQRGLLEGLDRTVSGGAVRKLRQFWITNVIALDIEARQVPLMAELPGVRKVFQNREIRLTGYKGVEAQAQAGTEWNIWKIRAPSLWSMGYTGRGVLVCFIDSGADGTHRALSSKWKGARVPGSAASWHDPYNFSSFPVDDDVSIGPTHGTSVAGVLVGSEGSDTVGVAPGAQWIAANAFEGPGQNSTYETILDCLEWAADPDGDPSTDSDVPDVINNSWGTPGPGLTGLCEDVLWDAIDAVEAVGAMVFFAAGNYGPSPSTTTSPASRVDSDVNTFAVGATGEYDEVVSFSGRGPSPCDYVTVKPETVAPGEAVRSSRGVAAGGGYQINSGTSFSTPHVSGLAALLRQSSSTSDGDDIKRAILNSASDLGDPGEDNTSGKGLVNAEAAQVLLGGPGSPVLKLLSVEPAPLAFTPGDTARVTATVCNIGLTASDVHVTIADLTGGLVEVIDGSTNLGSIGSHGEANNAADPFVIYAGQDVAMGSEIRLSLTVNATGYEEIYDLRVFVGEPNAAGYVDHTAGNVVFTVTNFGQYGFNNGTSQVGSGFRFPADGPNWLFTGFFLAGIGSGAVSDGLGGLDTDWVPAEGSPLHILRSGGKADEEGRARYEDSAGQAPLPVVTYQRSYAFSNPAREDFIILHYQVKNNGAAALDSMYAGLYFDWDINANAYNRNEVGWIDTLSLGYMFNTDFNQHMGLSVLAGPLASHRAVNVRDDLYNSLGMFDFTDAKKWDFLTSGFEHSTSTAEADWAHMLSIGPLDIAAGDSAEFAYAVIAGEGLTDLMENARSARSAWESIQTDPPPVFLISVLADPLVSEYLKLSAVPSEPLAGDPTITVDGEILPVEMIVTGNVVLYSADYVVDAEGDHIVTVSGIDLGGATGQSSEWFTALYMGPDLAGGRWTSDGQFGFFFPEGAVKTEGFVYLAVSRTQAPELPAGLTSVAGPYKLLPEGLDLSQESTVSFRIEEGTGQVPPGSLRILSLTPNGWEEMEASPAGESEISARVSRLGTFVLARGPGSPGVPGRYFLSQNFPNPFNPQTTIIFDVPEGAGDRRVRVEIFNLRGQLVRALFSGEKKPGSYELVWDGKDFRGDEAASGIYLCSMVVDGHALTRKMVLLK